MGGLILAGPGVKGASNPQPTVDQIHERIASLSTAKALEDYSRELEDQGLCLEVFWEHV